MAKPLQPEDIAEIQSLFKRGLTIVQVAEQTGRSKPTVAKFRREEEPETEQETPPVRRQAEWQTPRPILSWKEGKHTVHRYRIGESGLPPGEDWWL